MRRKKEKKGEERLQEIQSENETVQHAVHSLFFFFQKQTASAVVVFCYENLKTFKKKNELWVKKHDCQFSF